MFDKISAIIVVISFFVSFVFGILGDYYNCKICRERNGLRPSDENHCGDILAILFGWNIGILWFWGFPIYAVLKFNEYHIFRKSQE